MITDQMVERGVDALAEAGQRNAYNHILVRIVLTAALGDAGWQDISTAPKDGSRVLLLLKNLLPVERDDLDRWHGIPFVGRHPGICEDGLDIGWNFAAPVGHGGFPDDWFEGWQPIPTPPLSRQEHSATTDGKM